MTDASQWPFPIPQFNSKRFQEALEWLLNNNIRVKGRVDHTLMFTQTIQVAFTSQVDLLAFKLQFGDLITS